MVSLTASGPGRPKGSLLFNPGGPAVSGVDAVRDPETAQVLDEAGGGRFDVVSWDTRGSGKSATVRCFRTAGAEARFGAIW